jgi:amino acid permease
MSMKAKQFAVAVAMLVGTIIGVGIFGVPYAIHQLGWPLAAGFFVLVGAVQLAQQLFYAEAAAATEEKARFPGLVRMFLGGRYRQVALVAWAAAIWASLVAYVLLGGTFLFTLLGPLLGGGELHYQIAWAVVGALLLTQRLDVVARINFFATVLLAAALLVIVGAALGHVEPANFGTRVIDPVASYGVILFSLAGVTAITEMEEEVGGDRRLFRASIVTGLLVSLALTALFGFVVYGVTGAATTTDAVTGLGRAVGGFVPLLVAGAGFFAVATSFIAGGTDLREVFRLDYKMGGTAAWLLVVGVPAAFLAAGARDFLSVIGFSAAVFGGASAVMVTAMYIAITRRNLLGAHRLGVPVGVAYAVIAVLLSGALLTLGQAVRALV